VDHEHQLRLWRDNEINDYIKAQARRYFKHSLQDQEDLSSYFWMRVGMSANNVDIYSLARRAAHTFWKQDYRRRQDEKKYKQTFYVHINQEKHS
jgi:hypothetical protein